MAFDIAKVPELFAALRQVASFEVVQGYVKRHVGRPGTSWAHLEERVRDTRDQRLVDQLADAYADVRLHGKCHVFVYDVDDTTNIRRIAARVPVVESSLFPLGAAIQVAQGDEGDALKQVPELVHRFRTSNDDIGLVFSSSRRVRFDDAIELSLLEQYERVRERIKGADSVLVRRREIRTAYDVLIVGTNRLEIWIDHFPENAVPDYLTALRSVQRATMACLALPGNPFARPKNFGPAMRKMYDAADEGRVVGMSFHCATGTRRKETPLANKDLRREEYHMAGMAKIDGMFEPYRLSVAWDKDSSGDDMANAVVTFPGTVALIGTDKVLYHLLFPLNSGSRAHDFAMSRVMAHADDA